MTIILTATPRRHDLLQHGCVIVQGVDGRTSAFGVVQTLVQSAQYLQSRIRGCTAIIVLVGSGSSTLAPRLAPPWFAPLAPFRRGRIRRRWRGRLGLRLIVHFGIVELLHVHISSSRLPTARVAREIGHFELFESVHGSASNLIGLGGSSLLLGGGFS